MNDFQPSRPDEVRMQRGLVNVVLFFIAIAAAVYAVKSRNPLIMCGVVVIPFLPLLMSRPGLLFVLAALLDASNIRFSSIAGTTYGFFPRILLTATVLLGVILQRSRPVKFRFPERKVLFWFVCVILLLMLVRGSGLRALGSRTWGGMIYIVLLTGIGFVMASPKIRVPMKSIRWITVGSCAVALLIGVLGRYTSRLDVVNTDESANGRAQWLVPIIMGVLPLVFAFKSKRPLLRALLFLSFLFLMALTGFRSKLANLVIVLVGYGFFAAGPRRLPYLFKIGLAGLVCWIGLVVVSPVLPKGAQRAISFVPGVSIDVDAAKSAENSTDWRLEVWKYALAQSGPFLLIGRGSSFDAYAAGAQVNTFDILTFTPWFAYQTHNYHSGPISLLVDYGLTGFLIALWLVVLVIKRFWGYAEKMASFDTFESRYALYVCISILWGWVGFFLVFGSMSDFSRLLALTGVGMVVANSILEFEKSKEKEEENVTAAVAVPRRWGRRI